jgi:hypothetical protein
VYLSRNVDDNLLADIRSDSGVKAVYYDHKLSID